MAQRVQVVLEDDLDGGDAAETVVFGLDGAEYEIDLSAKNAAKLRDAFAVYVASGRRTGGRRKRAAVAPAAVSDAAAIRAWAADNGVEVSAKGRIPESVREQYEKASSKVRRSSTHKPPCPCEGQGGLLCEGDVATCHDCLTVR